MRYLKHWLPRLAVAGLLGVALGALTWYGLLQFLPWWVRGLIEGPIILGWIILAVWAIGRMEARARVRAVRAYRRQQRLNQVIGDGNSVVREAMKR